MESVCQELREFLSREVLTSGVKVTNDAVLAELGVDSFALMEVVLFVERRFGVVLPVEQLTRDNVRSVAALSRCVVAWMPTVHD
jgi:acyl carrier protein